MKKSVKSQVEYIEVILLIILVLSLVVIINIVYLFAISNFSLEVESIFKKIPKLGLCIDNATVWDGGSFITIKKGTRISDIEFYKLSYYYQQGDTVVVNVTDAPTGFYEIDNPNISSGELIDIGISPIIGGDPGFECRYPSSEINIINRSSCIDILNSGQSVGDGIYKTYPGRNPLFVYCDMTTDGGGWMLVLAYNRKTNSENPELDNETWPLDPHNSLSHVDNISQFGFAPINEVRLQCDTSNRVQHYFPPNDLNVIHFKTNNKNVVKSIYDDTVGAEFSDFKDPSEITYLSGHAANIPIGGFSFSSPNGRSIFGNDFPIFEPFMFHWGVGGHLYRWECDDWDFLAQDMISTTGIPIPSHKTNHTVWVR